MDTCTIIVSKYDTYYIIDTNNLDVKPDNITVYMQNRGTVHTWASEGATTVTVRDDQNKEFARAQALTLGVTKTINAGDPNKIISVEIKGVKSGIIEIETTRDLDPLKELRAVDWGV